ncbi:SIS domain-containing protein [Nocardia sp. CDC159]|uniref:SIS domain-containing protein n=1 Tax=Nocardia pulmonis TaxID=2951408 RepID=A0A9X2E0V9_9NOCA|nr:MULTISPECIES: SIS domain-containing protein [Nocardia]MCM6772122.1 SIS domain-containing protein [Nocardia pulmonis]MCM6785220.1 SIS domain-containing protein [Nocardia sp. CDC159]
MLDDRFTALERALRHNRPAIARLWRWGDQLAEVYHRGGRVLACGNGGSAAEAQHLTAELTGRFEGERDPLPAFPLHADTSTLTAVVNDYGIEDMFARQVRAHARPGDVLIVLSTSGSSPNVVAAAKAAHETGALTWALTGPAPNPLAALCHDAIAVDADRVATVQEVHLLLIHSLCAALESALGLR